MPVLNPDDGALEVEDDSEAVTGLLGVLLGDSEVVEVVEDAESGMPVPRDGNGM